MWKFIEQILKRLLSWGKAKVDRAITIVKNNWKKIMDWIKKNKRGIDTIINLFLALCALFGIC